ncbi:RNA-binding protein 20-like isoform X3 [Astatotilapia calliptera]|uniref:RNA-binding protein 20-like isoform X3 n=1 Tax=Astatotilapia calliptera TaxID=8154 RepID=UPI000E40696D|nr:RNA-binding protein 20-like isoform X3 [Astatotilapia calliptera]
MTTSPFVFPTVSPWFTIPEYLTVSEPDDIEKAQSQGSTFSTIMLTGLPEGNYRQEDVTKLVWRYVPDQTVQTLYYKIIVLSLQRRVRSRPSRLIQRNLHLQIEFNLMIDIECFLCIIFPLQAFVFFNSWDACCDFARDYLKNPVTVGEWTLRIHIVLQDMLPGTSEHVPESESLEDRLLSVEVSEVNVDLVMMIMEVVASIAAFVRFLPLANRICIEMAEPGGLTQVMESKVTKDYLSACSKAGRIESLKSLKQRLQDSGDNLKMKTKKTAESTDAVTKGDCQAESQRTEEEAGTQPDAAAAPAGQQPEPKCPDDETQEGEENDGWSMADIKVVAKRRRELVGAEAKPSRSQSPCVVADFRLPQFNPNSPIGQEFVVPKSGFFCNICSVFCLNEKTAKELHCCSQKHYDNLQKYYEERRQRATKALSQTSPGSVSD